MVGGGRPTPEQVHVDSGVIAHLLRSIRRGFSPTRLCDRLIVRESRRDLQIHLVRGFVLKFFRVLKFFSENLSLHKPGMQRHPIGFLGVVEQAELLGDRLGGQTGQVGSRQAHECFGVGAGHGDL